MPSIRLFILVALLTALAGCQTAPTRVAPAPPPPRTVEAAPAVPEQQPVSDDVAPAPMAEASRAVVEPGTGEFINRNAAARVVPTVPGAGDVTFNW